MTGYDDRKQVKILAVAAHAAELDQLKSILEGAGYAVVTAGTGLQAVEMVTAEPVGLVFCDVSLPDMQGLEVLQQVKQFSPAVQVVMFSEQQDFHMVRQILRERAQDFLVRPMAARDVVAAAERGLAAYAAEMHQDQVYQEAQRRMSDLVLLKQIGETTSSQNEPTELFERIVDSITESVGVESASLMLLEEDGTLKIAAARGVPEDVIESVHVSAGQGVSGHVLETREPLLIRDVEQERHFHDLVGGARYKTRSLLTVPIMIRDRLLGIINVNNKLTGEQFSGEDQSLLVTIAHQVALAMENFTLVHNLRQQARSLERANRDLVKLNNAKTRMVTNLSHELKTPLTSMLGFVDLSLTFFSKLSPEELQDYLRQVQEEGGKLERLITGMLRLFSIESERENWRWREFSVDMAIDGALQGLAGRIEERSLQTGIDVDPDLPDIYGDYEKFSIALCALMDNAVKFNRDGGRLDIRATATEIDGLCYVRLQVANDGDAIPYEAREIIFDQYTQLGEIDTGKPCGVGVGLALVKVVIDRMRGQVELDERLGEGTAFSLLLPTAATYHVLEKRLEEGPV